MNSSQNIPAKSLVTLAMLALLAGCNRGDSAPHPVPSTKSAPTLPGRTSVSGNTDGSPVVPEPGSSLLHTTHGNLAGTAPSVFREIYGVGVTRIADSTASDSQPIPSDQDFLKDATEGGLYEVEAARIGSQRTRSPTVKAFADMLANQHSAANAELKRIAGTWNLEIPMEPPVTKRRALDRLRNINGKDFDRDFIKTVGIEDHEDTIKRFEKAMHEVKDANILAWVEKTLPTLR